MSCLWGKLASEILMQHWTEAYDDLNRLKEAIEASTSRSPLEQLHQRTWFIHWSLFVYFNHPKGRDDLVQLFLSSSNPTANQSNAYLNTLQTASPHLLRYLAAAVIINPRKKNERTLKELVKVIQQVLIKVTCVVRYFRFVRDRNPTPSVIQSQNFLNVSTYILISMAHKRNYEIVQPFSTTTFFSSVVLRNLWRMLVYLYSKLSVVFIIASRSSKIV
jgi:hypothetical protein